MRTLINSILILSALTATAATQEAPYYYGSFSASVEDSLNGASTGLTFPSFSGERRHSVGVPNTAPSGFGFSYGTLKPFIDVENDRQNYGGR